MHQYQHPWIIVRSVTRMGKMEGNIKTEEIIHIYRDYLFTPGNAFEVYKR